MLRYMYEHKVHVHLYLQKKSLENKRTLGPWIANLRMNVYTGKGKHSSSQSPPMNFDRSSFSLILVMLHFIRACTVCYDNYNI